MIFARYVSENTCETLTSYPHVVYNTSSALSGTRVGADCQPGYTLVEQHILAFCDVGAWVNTGELRCKRESGEMFHGIFLLNIALSKG